MSHIDDAYNRLRRNIGNDFGREERERIVELHLFHCGNCGYRNIHNIKILTCGCGKELEGILVYRKIGDTVVYDTTEKRRKR